MKFTDIINSSKYIKYGYDTNNYINNRYNELKNKGYNNKDAQDLIHFELGLKFTIAPALKYSSKGACFAGGAGIGASVGTFFEPGFGTFAGAGIGGLGALQACNSVIDFAADKGLQKLSENLYKQYKDDRTKEIDLKQIQTYISARKTYIDSQKPRSAEIKAKNQFISNPKQRTIYDALMSMPAPTGFAADVTQENKFSNYSNPINGSPKIYTRESIGDMTTDEYLSAEKEINAQLNSIGIPNNAEMQSYSASGDVVYVNAYTRSDGTDVKSYYRAKGR